MAFFKRRSSSPPWWGTALRCAVSSVAWLVALNLVGFVPAEGSTPAKSPKGDPGGIILRELASLKSAVPKSTHIVNTVEREPHLTNSCMTTTPEVQVDFVFTSHDSVARMHELIMRALETRKWTDFTASGPSRWYDTINGRQQLADNYIYRQQKRLPQGMTAVATLQVGVPTEGWQAGQRLTWDLGSAVTGIDEPKRHCGSG
jgi:hypothetical protein